MEISRSTQWSPDDLHPKLNQRVSEAERQLPAHPFCALPANPYIQSMSYHTESPSKFHVSKIPYPITKETFGAQLRNSHLKNETPSTNQHCRSSTPCPALFVPAKRLYLLLSCDGLCEQRGFPLPILGRMMRVGEQNEPFLPLSMKGQVEGLSMLEFSKCLRDMSAAVFSYIRTST